MADPAHRILRLYREMWQHARGKRGTLIAAMACLLGAQLPRLLAPFLAALALDTLQARGFGGLGAAAGWLALMFACTPASWVLHGIGRVLERNTALLVRSRVSEDLLGRVLVLPLRWHETQHSGATAKRIEQSAHALFRFTQTQFVYLQNAMRFVGPVVVLALIDPLVGFAAAVGLIGIGAATFAFDGPLVRLASAENEAERGLTSALVDTLGNITTVHALRQSGGLIRLVRRRLEAVYVPLRRSIVLNELKWCSTDLLCQGLCCALLVLYIWSQARGITEAAADRAILPWLSLGSVYMVWEYSRQAVGVITNFAAYFQEFARQRADYAAGDEIRSARPAEYQAPAEAQAVPWQRLDVSELSFQHVGIQRAVDLKHIDLELRRGRRYALVGASGSGKSTLLRVLAGLYVAEKLSLRCDDIALSSPLEAAAFLRANATLLPQDTHMFPGTVLENLELCATVSGAAPTRGVASALALACTEDFTGPAAEQLGAPVAERGANLSGGQRQRLALARAALAAEGSSLVLLDEPTASLDSVTEGCVFKRLLAAFGDACIVCSVHRLTLLPYFDEAIVLDGGRLLDQGPVADFRERSAPFRSLLESQALTDKPVIQGRQSSAW